MDILIKDSSLPPTNCYGCRFFKEEHYKDVFQDREYDVIGECLAGEFQIEKPYFPYDGICPLVELPENHGRIVDLDRVLDWLINEKRVFSMAMSAKLVKALSDAPVVLEAST